jgi:hypothetical protein
MSLGMSYEERVKTQRAFAAEMRQNEGESQLTRLLDEVARKRKALSDAEHRLANHPFKYLGARVRSTFDYRDHAALYRERNPYDPWIPDRPGL